MHRFRINKQHSRWGATVYAISVSDIMFQLSRNESD